MDYTFNFVTFVCIVLKGIIMLIDLPNVRCRPSEPRVVTTRYGNSTGMIVTFQNKLLHPIEVFSGFQYASTRRDKMRFIPPVSSLEKWLGIRMFSNRSYRGVCPQQFNIVKNNSVNSSFHFLNRLRRVEPYTIYQGEDCLMLNMYVPNKGKNCLLIITQWR